MAEQYLKDVRNQYEHLPYPLRDPKNELEGMLMPLSDQLPVINQYCFGGKRDFREPFRVLIAGGGTGDAAIAMAEQLLEFGHRVTYLDISLASTEVAKKRAEIRCLDNIDWIHASILDIPKLNLETFDYINCSGVLHHLADPEAGLQALSSVLKDDGAMHIMLYAQYGRFSVYLMQDIFRTLNRDAPDINAQMENALKVLNHVPQDHWLLYSPPIVLQELRNGDNAIYDALLHTQDRAYTVPETYDYLASSGLVPAQFFADDALFGHRLYDPAIYFTDEDLRQKVSALPLAKKQKLAELMNSKICKQDVYAMRSAPPVPSAKDQDFVPFFFSFISRDVVALKPQFYEAIKKSGDWCNFALAERSYSFAKMPLMLPILRYIDGMMPIRGIFEAVMNNKDYKKLEPTVENLTATLDYMLQIFGAHDVFFLRHESLPPFLPSLEYQARMKERRKARGL